MSDTQSRKKLPSLQYFRGIAAILVVLHHLTGIMDVEHHVNYLHGSFAPGWSGVDFFFVLSGFIIAFIHMDDIGKKEKVLPFLKKRTARIYPIYWVATLLFLPIYLLSTKTSIVSVIKSFLLIPQNVYPILQVGWTLSFELFFYLLFGLLMVFRRRYSLTLFGIWTILVLLFLPTFPDVDKQVYKNFIISPYDFEFLLGCVSAYIIRKTTIRFNFLVLSIGIIGFLMSWLSIQYGIFTKFSVSRLLGFGISSALIIVGAASIDLSNNKIKTSKIFLYLGDASYSIYLTHLPIFIVLGKVFSVLNIYKLIGTGLTATLMLVFTILIGSLFHYLVEKPLLKHVNSLMKKYAKVKKDSDMKSA